MASKCSGSGVRSSPGSLLALPGDACRQAVLLDTPSLTTLPRLVNEGLQQPPSGSEPCPALAGKSQRPSLDFSPGLLRVGVQSSRLGSDAAKWLPASHWHFRAPNPQEGI